MSSVMRCRSGVMESSFAKWNVLQAATPCFRTGALARRQKRGRTGGLRINRLGGRQIPRSGLVQGRISRPAFTDVSVSRTAPMVQVPRFFRSGTERARHRIMPTIVAKSRILPGIVATPVLVKRLHLDHRSVASYVKKLEI